MLKFHPRIAPVKAAVFPLVKKDGMPEMAETIYRELKRHFNVFYDEKGAIGRRYRRQDEAGTPFCITVDSQTPDRRHRDVPRPRHLPAVARARRRASSRRCDDLLEGPADPRGIVRPSAERSRPVESRSAITDPGTDHETLHQPGDDPDERRSRPTLRRTGAGAGRPSSSG